MTSHVMSLFTYVLVAGSWPAGIFEESQSRRWRFGIFCFLGGLAVELGSQPYWQYP
jgi:hypothetical protein